MSAPSETTEPGQEPSGKKKKKDKKKKAKGRGFFRAAVDVAFKVLPFLGIKIPGSIKSVAKEALKGAGLKGPGLGGIGGGIGKGDLRDAGRMARTVAGAAALSTGYSSSGGNAGVDSGTDSVEGITIEAFARATAAMARAGQSGGNLDDALRSEGLDLALYQRITPRFTELLQKDTGLATRYAQAYQSAMAG